MDRLVKPHSANWANERPGNTSSPAEKHVKKGLGDGTDFSDKITMLGIVEATFGGQRGYLEQIVADELGTSKQSEFEQETSLLREYRRRRK
jgi:hypothetical protein